MCVDDAHPFRVACKRCARAIDPDPARRARSRVTGREGTSIEASVDLRADSTSVPVPPSVWHVWCNAGGMQGALFIISPESFRDEEFFVPKEELEGAGWRCVVASRYVGSCSGMRGGHATATLALADVDVADYDVIVFVGGSGAHTYFDDSVALRVAREAEAAGKIVAAICIAPSILARAGVLTGKRATCFVSERSALTAAGAHVESASVVIDGRVVTADGPRAAHDFAAAILRIAAPHRSSGTTQSLRAARDRSGA